MAHDVFTLTIDMLFFKSIKIYKEIGYGHNLDLLIISFGSRGLCLTTSGCIQKNVPLGHIYLEVNGFEMVSFYDEPMFHGICDT